MCVCVLVCAVCVCLRLIFCCKCLLISDGLTRFLGGGGGGGVL